MTRPLRNAYCCYCRRTLTPAAENKETSFSMDHVIAQSEGGWKRVPCCRKCNLLKDNLPTNDWFWFIGAHPRWWKEFKLPSQVARVVREYRFMVAAERRAAS